MAEVGVHVAGGGRAGTYILHDTHSMWTEPQSEGFELCPIAQALEKYTWLRPRYCWNAVPTDLDTYTSRCASKAEPQGYFIHVKQGEAVALPIQACMYIAQADLAQTVHNIVIVEENAELHLITGCTALPAVERASHVAVSEYYVGRNARLTSTMVHSWGSEVTVHPRSGTIVEEGGAFVSNYVSLRPARTIQNSPRTWLNGTGASAKYLSVVLSAPGSMMDLGGEVVLNAEDTRAELAHRAVCTGGRVLQRGLLIGNAPCRAHVDCAGMVLDAGDQGYIESIPGLKALHPDARMSHEASIGRIAPEQVQYLQSRGMEEREAISLIIRGFLSANITGLGRELDARIAEVAELAGHGEG
jgi:hypothetical protein